MAPDLNTTPTMIQCRNCGAGAPLREHFCPQCTHILALSRHGDYFIFFGLPRRLSIDLADLERRFRDLSRQFHPDFFYNSTPAARLASLERSSYLNDAYRTLRQPAERAEYLLGLEGMAPEKLDAGTPGQARVPAALLQEVFALNEELDEIRESREAGGLASRVAARLQAVRAPVERRQEEHEQQVTVLSARWDERHERTTLEALRECLLERNYLRNLLATIDKESNGLGLTAQG